MTVWGYVFAAKTSDLPSFCVVFTNYSYNVSVSVGVMTVRRWLCVCMLVIVIVILICLFFIVDYDYFLALCLRRAENVAQTNYDHFKYFLTQLTASCAESITSQKSCLSLCLCVNQGGTNHNHYTKKLVILHGPTDQLWSQTRNWSVWPSLLGV